MARSKEYTKAARWQGLINGASLWMGSDHVLSIRNVRFSEEYKRYYYGDIQALMMREGPRWWCPSWLWGVFATLLIASLFLSAMRRFAFAGGCELSLLALGFLVLFRSLLRGCYCYVVTEVATEELTGVRTQSAARKAKAALMERITAQQGPLPEGWEDLVPEANSGSVRQHFAFVSGREPVGPVPVMGIWTAVAAICCTILDGVLSFGQLRQWPVPETLGLFNVLAGVAAGVTGVVLLRDAAALKWLRNATLLCVLAMGSVTYIAHVLGTTVSAFPPSVRSRISGIQHGVGILNVTGDLLTVGFAVVLWLRQRSRSEVSTNQPVASTGEV